MVHEEMAQRPNRTVRQSPGKRGGAVEGNTQPPKNRKECSRAVVSDGERARRKREKTSAGAGSSVTAQSEVRKWEAERVARHLADWVLRDTSVSPAVTL